MALSVWQGTGAVTGRQAVPQKRTLLLSSPLHGTLGPIALCLPKELPRRAGLALAQLLWPLGASSR